MINLILIYYVTVKHITRKKAASKTQRQLSLYRRVHKIHRNGFTVANIFEKIVFICNCCLPVNFRVLIA